MGPKITRIIIANFCFEKIIISQYDEPCPSRLAPNSLLHKH